MSFRKDINGLRAIAVIGVVIFHFFPNALPGGFAGVDVFFVISGFLMTGIIFKALESNNFSLIKFYIARANRIIPSLAVLCLVLIFFGYFYLAALDYKILGRDVSTSMLFVSNFMFSLRGGYFDTSDNFLLHTWSLSVEWQFYILYPIIIIIFSRYLSILRLKKIVFLLFLVSFILSVFATQYWSRESYFLLPTRAWEMLLGGLAFIYPLKFNTNKFYTNKYFLETLGLGLICSSYFLFSKYDLWPGYFALLPTLGTWLIIQVYLTNSYLTSNLILQKIGRWSYSIYLWHWPIAVSFSYYGIEEKFKVIGLLLSVFLGYLNYIFIEKIKFKAISQMKMIMGYILLTLFFLVIGFTLFKSQGFADRYSLLGNSIIQGGLGDNYIIEEGTVLLNSDHEYDFTLIGDSNANHLTRGIMRSGLKVKMSWYQTCISLPDSINLREGASSVWKENCKNNYKNGINDSVILIAQSWVKPNLECASKECNLTNNYYKDLEQQLGELIKTYGENKRVYILGELPKPKDKIGIMCLRGNNLLGINSKCNSIYEPRDEGREVNNVLKRVVSKYHNVNYIDLDSVFCKGNTCDFAVNGKSLYMVDGGHLSGFGSELVWDHIVKSLHIVEK